MVIKTEKTCLTFKLPLRIVLSTSQQWTLVIRLHGLVNKALYISNDTGGAHMAAAMNCPTVALFGPTDPNRYRPIGKRATYIKTPSHTDDKEHPMQPLSVTMVYQEIIQSLFPIQKH